MIDIDIINSLNHVVDFKNWEHKYGIIDGFLGATEGYTLLLLAEKGYGEGEIVEIGSYMGRSTCWLATGSKRAGREKITAIDPFTGSEEHSNDEVIKNEGSTYNSFLKNLKQMELDDYVVPIISRSEDAVKKWNKPIRLLFIDGDHTYENVKKDFSMWSPFVIKSGFICFHDIESWEGPTRFYKELKNSCKILFERISINNLRAMEKLI